MLVIIRHARPSDIPAMTGLLGELFSLEADFEVDEEKQARGLARLLEQPGACVLVAVDSGDVAGMVSIQPLISTAQGGLVGMLEDLVVRRGSRGQGIGTLLLDAAMRWAAGQGMTRLQLLADRANARALDFYTAHGWRGTELICLRAAEFSAPAVA